MAILWWQKDPNRMKGRSKTGISYEISLGQVSNQFRVKVGVDDWVYVKSQLEAIKICEEFEKELMKYVD